ncbi:MAG: DUF480 domain-containing protein [Acidimicrobiales bacterium]
MELSEEELRILGCLVEKRLTTPQQYPLTLNALALACNQASNRDPVVDYDEARVEAAVTRAKTRGLVAFVHPSHGRSALRFRHTLDEHLGLGEQALALLAVLALRGAQTPGELRARTERMARFAGLDEVQAELDALAERDEPLVVRLGRGPGQKEDRYAHLLGTTPLPGPAPTDDGWRSGGEVTPPAVASHRVETAPAAASPRAEVAPRMDVTALGDEVHRLRAEVQALRRDLDALRSELGA